MTDKFGEPNAVALCKWLLISPNFRETLSVFGHGSPVESAAPVNQATDRSTSGAASITIGEAALMMAADTIL